MELHHTNFIQNSNEGTDGGGALLIENTRSTIGNTALVEVLLPLEMPPFQFKIVLLVRTKQYT